MKKLLVTIIGAAVAFGAFADAEPGAREIGPGVRFEELTETTNTVDQLNTLTGNYWSEPAGATNVYTRDLVANYSGYGQYEHPPAWNEEGVATSTKALGVKTSFGSPLSFSVNTNGTAVSIDDGLYFDSMVKFTVCEDPVTTEYEGAKIVMWLQESTNSVGDVNGTNLLVRAGYLSKDTRVAAAPTIYTGNNITIGGDFADKWHRVTIKSIADITEGSRVPGFAIFIDKNRVQAQNQDKWDSSFSGNYTLTEIARNLGAGLFPSLVQANDEVADYQKISSVAFDGTGSINELQFYGDDIAPSFAGNDQYLDDKFDVSIDGGDPAQLKKLSDVVAAVNGCTVGQTCRLTLANGFAFDGTMAFNTQAQIEIDLRGKAITNNNDTVGVYAITLAQGTYMTVTDSVGGGAIVAANNYAVYAGNEASFTLTGGTIDGNIGLAPIIEPGTDDEVGPGECYLMGGTVKQDDIDPVDGYALVERVDGFYDVVPAFTVTFVDGETTLTNIANVATNTLANDIVGIPENPVKAGATFTGWSPAIDTTYIVSNTTFTAQWTADSYTITFLDADDTVISSTEMAYGSLLTPTDPTPPTGQSFKGWNPTVVSPVVAAATYKAQYTNNIYTITFVIGESSSSVQKEYGSEITSVPGIPVRAGYTGAWDDDPAGDTVTGDKTYTYTYSPETYTITYKNADGTAFTAWADNYAAPASFTVVTVVTLPTSSDVVLGTVGSTFNGWTNNVGTAVLTTSGLTANLEVFADVTAGGTNPTIIDPSNPAASTATVSADSEEAAIQAVTVTAPAGSGATDADYKALFDYTATDNGNDTYDVAISDIKESVKEAVATTAEAIVSGTAETGTVTVPAGLYYKVTTYTALGGTPTVAIKPVLSTGAASSAITKPGTTQGFIKVEIATTAAELAD